MRNIFLKGVSIGSYARKVVRDLITDKDFETDLNLIKKAVNIDRKLVQDNLREIQR